jgi:hypothetical protein
MLKNNIARSIKHITSTKTATGSISSARIIKFKNIKTHHPARKTTEKIFSPLD